MKKISADIKKIKHGGASRDELSDINQKIRRFEENIKRQEQLMKVQHNESIERDVGLSELYLEAVEAKIKILENL